MALRLPCLSCTTPGGCPLRRELPGGGAVETLCSECNRALQDSVRESSAAKAHRLATMPPPRNRSEVIDRAELAHEGYPQYDGYWNDPEWSLIRIKTRLETKLGVAFEPGDLTVARMEEPNRWNDHKGFLQAYSWRNECNTSVPLSAAEIA